jgi:hypothetical protein
VLDELPRHAGDDGRVVQMSQTEPDVIHAMSIVGT